MHSKVHTFFDAATSTFTHVVHDPSTRRAAVIDAVLDYDPKSGRTSTTSADQVIHYLREHELGLDWILETHAHADHMSGARYLQEQLGGVIGIGAHIDTVQTTFKRIFNLESEFATDGSQFGRLFEEGDRIPLGALSLEVLSVPGHTPADVAYRIDDMIFVGDTLFMPDVGTARCDFPGGDAHRLYQSIRRILSHPPQTKLYLCHDYPPSGRQECAVTTVEDQRLRNIHVHDGVSEDAYVAMRATRDASLAMPVLLLPSIQVNIRAGEFPAAESNGQRYLKIPINAL